MDKQYSVMKKEAIELLGIKENGIYVDGTLGRGGHSEEILKRIGDGKLYAFDLDEEAIKESKEFLNNDSRLHIFHNNFANMKECLDTKVDGILLDLGVSSPQFDEGERGFSYRFDAPLDMRMDQSKELTAKKIVNEYSIEELTRIFRDNGEERFAYQIAKKIDAQRKNKPIETTFELVDVIKASLPAKELAKKGHPAKQVFQALRIAANDELGSLEKFLNDFPDLLNEKGRVVIITFHSLEDRLVKRRFNDLTKVKVDKRIVLLPEEIEEAPFVSLTRKAIKANEVELQENNRSHSALLRAIEKRG